jgi:hypothetical protein
MILPLLFVPLVYSISSIPNVCAAPREPGFDHPNAECVTRATDIPGGYETECCWSETDEEGISINYCQRCDYDPTTRTHSGCGEKYPMDAPPPTPTPSPTVPGTVPEDGVLEQPEQPLFGGQNDAGVPPTGGIEQPPAATQPTPGGGAGVPTEGGSAEQPPTSQDDQNDNQGGGLPNIKNQENVPPGGGVAEQPEADDGQEGSSEGAETAGPLT